MLDADGMCWRRTFPGRPNQVEAARKLPALLLAGTGCEDDAEWIAAELASNAVAHTRSGDRRGWFGVEVRLGSLAQISVYDLGGWGVPRVEPESAAEELREHGRGLLGVSRLAAAMGVSGSPEEGHTVWARLGLEAEAPTARLVS